MLGAALHQPPQNMTNLADGLEQAGLLRRVADSADRRIIRLQLTEAGREKAARVESLLETAATALLPALPDRELEGLHQLLDELTG